jgi:Thiopurine S-methyltransferase (TPMT)
LIAFIESLEPSRNILVPGCGQDFRTIAALHHAGHRVTAIDFCPIAFEATKKALPEMHDDIVLGDFFTYDFENALFDLIYERTFLCSLPPSLWKSYATRVARLLHPGGTLAGFFFYGKEPDPPPYPLTKPKAAEIFGVRFRLQTTEPVTDSLAVFGGKEEWQQWRLRKR